MKSERKGERETRGPRRTVDQDEPMVGGDGPLSGVSVGCTECLREDPLVPGMLLHFGDLRRSKGQ